MRNNRRYVFIHGFVTFALALTFSKSCHAMSGIEGIAWFIYESINNYELGLVLYTIAGGIVGVLLTYSSVNIFVRIQKNGGDLFQKSCASMLFIVGIVFQVPYIMIWLIYYVNDMYKNAGIGMAISITIFFLFNIVGVYVYQRFAKSR